jgi:hypothetical protein
VDENKFSQGEALNNMLRINFSTEMQPTSSPNRKNVWSVFFSSDFMTTFPVGLVCSSMFIVQKHDVAVEILLLL